MNKIIGITWYKDEDDYRRALELFIDSKSMPATFQAWQDLIKRECEYIKEAGDRALRVDIDFETFPDWCASRGFRPDAQGRTAYVNFIELEYKKTGKGIFVE